MAEDESRHDVGASVIVEPPVAVAIDSTVAAGGILPAAAMKFADLTESGSESGDEEAVEAGTSTAANGNARASPPPNCAICLSRCKRKCFTDSCLHPFCFKCLCEWSKIKPECPLCKQPFKTIIHNVRALDDYDRYPVETVSTPPLAEHPSLSFHIVNVRRRRMMMPLVQNQSVMTSANDIDGAGESEDGLINGEPPLRGFPEVNRFEPYRMELLNFYRNDQDAGNFRSLSQLWRRYVYDRKLYALPVGDSLTGQFRESSARFYRDNPAQIHRLMPWINRDIVCLLHSSPHRVTTVMHLINELLPMTNILGPSFRRRLTIFLGDRTSHFIHELFNFARSPFDMIGYERVVQYAAREEVEVDLDFLPALSSTEGESEGAPANNVTEYSNDWQPISQIRTPRPSTSVIVTNPSATHSFSVTMATDGSELPGISIRRTTTSNVGSQTVAINLSMRRPAGEVIEIDEGDAAANAEVAAITDNSNSSQSRRNAGASLPVSAHIELQSSDSNCSNSTDDDECVFVLERKPPHLRTPELVSLDSGSDSDVVFVDEQKPSKPATSAAVDANGNVTMPEQVPAGVPNELFMGPSTSTGVCSTSGKNWKKVLAEARRQDRLVLRSGRVKRVVRRSPYMNRCFAAAPVQTAKSSSSSSGSGSTSSSDSESSSDVSVCKKTRSFSSSVRAARPNMKANLNKRVKRQTRYNQFLPEQKEDEEDGDDSSSDSSRSSSSSSDSIENMQLSALKATLKAKTSTYESSQGLVAASMPKIEPPTGETEDHKSTYEASGAANTTEGDAEDDVSAPKRRRTSSSSCLYANLSSQSSMTSSLSSGSSSTSALSLFNTNANDGNGPLLRGDATSPHWQHVDDLVPHAIANTLIELSTGGQQRATAVFNDQSAGVEDAVSFLRNVLPDSANSLDGEARLDFYSDASNDLAHYQVDQVIDVVGNVASPNITQEAEIQGDVDDTLTATTEDNDDDEHAQDQMEDSTEDANAEEADADADEAVSGQDFIDTDVLTF